MSSWYPVVGFEGLYEISATGAVRGTKHRKLLSQVGKQFCLSKGGSPSLHYRADLLKASVPVGVVESSDYCFSDEKVFKPYSDTSTIGLAGEFLVCYELVRRGLLASNNVIANASYDVIADYGRGRLMKIQVKTASKPVLKENKSPAELIYKFKGLSSAVGVCDVFAYVALDEEVVVFELAAAHHGGDSRSFSVPSFLSKSGRTIDEVLIGLYGLKDKT